MKFRLARPHPLLDDCGFPHHILMLNSAELGSVDKHTAWDPETPWFAWNRLTSSTVGRYRTMREARAALEADIRQTIKRLAKEIEE